MQKEINSFLLRKGELNILINDDDFNILPMLTILKSLMLYFEKSNQPISNIFPKIKSALDAFEEIKNLFEDENTNQMYEQIIKLIKIYTLNSKEGGLWLLE